MGRFDDVKEHTTKEAANVVEEIKAHQIHLASARDRCLQPPSHAQPRTNSTLKLQPCRVPRYDIFVAVQPLPVTVWPIGSLEHHACLEHIRHALKTHFRRKVETNPPNASRIQTLTLLRV